MRKRTWVVMGGVAVLAVAGIGSCGGGDEGATTAAPTSQATHSQPAPTKASPPETSTPEPKRTVDTDGYLTVLRDIAPENVPLPESQNKLLVAQGKDVCKTIKKHGKVNDVESFGHKWAGKWGLTDVKAAAIMGAAVSNLCPKQQANLPA